MEKGHRTTCPTSVGVHRLRAYDQCLEPQEIERRSLKPFSRNPSYHLESSILATLGVSARCGKASLNCLETAPARYLGIVDRIASIGWDGSLPCESKHVVVCI